MRSSRPNLRTLAPRVLVTGGCGFIGSNLADRLACSGRQVLVLDSLTRAGVRENAEWLKRRHRDRIAIEIADVRDYDAVRSLVADASAVLHLAAQVAVTTSLQTPADDFAVNAAGTLNVLERIRRHNPAAPLLFASTNKVYGKLLHEDAVRHVGERCAPADPDLAAGVPEKAPLDLYSPYGCSKGAADQYVHDYARVFGLRTVVLRMSCIYGPRQFGTEDQGWIAHFLLQALRGQPIVIYGDGYQVRDTLHIDDAAAAWLRALERIDATAGRIFNLGGGPAHSVSLREMIDLIGEIAGRRPEYRFDASRPGDQPWYVSDTRAISTTLAWEPKVGLREGLRSLMRWLSGRFPTPAPVPPLQEASA